MAPRSDDDRERLGPTFRAIADFLEQGDMSEGLKLALDEVKLREAQNFEDAATATGQAWPPRKNPGDGHPLLIDTERMVASVLGDAVGLVAGGTAEGLGEHVEEIGPREAMTGTRNPYAGTHDAGAPNRNIPPRPFAHINEATADKIAEIMAEHLDEKIGDLL